MPSTRMIACACGRSSPSCTRRTRARCWRRSTRKTALKLIELLGDDFDFAALTEVDDAVREEILDELPTETVVEGVERPRIPTMPSTSSRTSTRRTRTRSWTRCRPTDRVALQKSLDYPEDSAGRLMQTDLIAVPPFWTVGQTLDHLRAAPTCRTASSRCSSSIPATGCSATSSSTGWCAARARPRSTRMMAPDRRRVGVIDDGEEVARLFERYNLVSTPVVDEAGRLVGVMTIDDIVDVMQEEADDEIKALGGVRGDEELSDRCGHIARSRFVWLFVNLITAFLASSVLGLFEGQPPEDGGAGRAGAHRGQPGRQRRDPDHDGRRPRAGDARAGRRQCLAGDAARSVRRAC